MAGRQGVRRPDRRLDAQGFLTEDGPRPEFAEQYGAAELPTDSEPARTEQNVQDSDATLWFGETTTAGAQATVGACLGFGKPCMPVYPGASFEPSHVATWIAENQIRTLNVAGNREGEEPGIGDRVQNGSSARSCNSSGTNEPDIPVRHLTAQRHRAIPKSGDQRTIVTCFSNNGLHRLIALPS